MSTPNNINQSAEPLLAHERIAYQFCGSGDMRGGVQDAVNTLAGYMSSVEAADTEVFIGGADDPLEVEEVFSNFKSKQIHILGGKNRYIVANGSQNTIGNLVRPARVRELLHQTDPSLVHIMAPWVPHIGGLVIRRSQKLGIPTVATYHIYSEERKTNLAVRGASLIDRQQIAHLDAVIAVSKPAEEHLRRYYGYKGDVHIIPNAIDVERYASALPFKANEPFLGFDPDKAKTIVFVGRPDQRKGLDTLIKAARTLKSRDIDFKMIICGDGPQLGEFQSQADAFDTNGQINFLGKVSDTNKARWLATADFAVFPAKGGESQGIVLLEAMAAGAGVVLGGDNKGYRSVLATLQHPDEVMFYPESSTQLASRIEMFTNIPAMASIIHDKQQELVRANYDIRVVGRQVAELYRKLIK